MRAGRSPCAASSATAACRSAADSCLRSGLASQLRSSRLPPAVVQRSSNDSSVGALSPRKVAVISRLRRVAASRARWSVARSTCSERTCASAACCVPCAYCSSAPAAATPSGASTAPNADRSCVPNCSHNLRVAASASNCHGGNARAGAVIAPCKRLPIRMDELVRRETIERRRDFRKLHVGNRQTSAGEVEPRNTGALSGDVNGHEQALALGVQHAGIRHCARRDDAHDFALDGALGSCGIADLLADGNRLAQPDELGEILLDGVIGHTRHRDRGAGGGPARSQRDVEERRRAFGVAIEHLVEIAHPIEHQLVRMLRLDAQVLLHHRRVCGQRRRRGWRMRVHRRHYRRPISGGADGESDCRTRGSECRQPGAAKRGAAARCRRRRYQLSCVTAADSAVPAPAT